LESLGQEGEEVINRVLVRHFLIEGSQKGVKVAGSDREPNFPSLAALIHQHAHTPLSLPIKLNIPLFDITTNDVIKIKNNEFSANMYYLHESGKYVLSQTDVLFYA